MINRMDKNLSQKKVRNIGSIDNFRVKNIQSDYDKSLAEDAKKFFSKKKTKSGCPVCGSFCSRKIHKIYGFYILECGCNFLYSYPRPTNKEQDKFYRFGKSNALWHKIIIGTKKVRVDNYIKNIVPLVGRYLKNSLLDVGCGEGLWLDAVREVYPKLNLFGIETVTRTKHRIIADLLENATGRFDTISLMSVLEHLVDPVESLRKCSGMLEDDGYLFLTMPNMRGFDSLALSVKDRIWEIPQHINYFDLDTIEKCLERASFEVVEKGTFGYLDVEIVRKNGKDLGNDFLNKLVYKDKVNFQEFLTKNGLSGQMYVIARKRLFT